MIKLIIKPLKMIEIKKILINIYYKVLKIKSRILYGNPVLVLMYHRINNSFGKNLRHLTVSTENFEEQLIYFKNNFKVLKFSDNWDNIKKNGIILTFDDGYADNFINALPLLEKYEIPAIFFISTLNISSNDEFWWDRLDYDFELLSDFFYLPTFIEKKSKRIFTFKIVSELVSKLNKIERDDWFTAFEKLNGINFINRIHFRSLSKDELIKISNNPLITIGIHTHNHYNGKNLNDNDLKEELINSVEIFNDLIPLECNCFAFPYGSYSKSQFNIIKGMGFNYLFLANDYYSNTKQKKDGIISRIIMTNMKGKELKNKLKWFV